MTLDQFFEKFELFADAPDAVAKMRELMLELAVQGKLVDQRSDEGNTVELLAAIERERNLGARNLRMPKAPSIAEQSPHPFEIPATWSWIQLGRIALQIQYGYTASADPLATEIRMLRITDIQNDRVDWPSVPGCQISATEAERYLLCENDILIARTGGTIGKSFVVPATPVKSVFASYLIRVTPPRSMAAGYLKIFLGCPFYWAQLRAMSAGTGQPNVNGQALGQLAIPLPPHAEQKRIVAKVDELMALCDRLEAQQQERETKHAALARASLTRFADAPTPANLQFLFHPSYTIPPADLRKSILTLAVQGKLVPQDPSDESAEELLARIEETKEQHIKNRTLRRVSVEPNPSGEALEPLPVGWTWSRLGNVFDVRDGTHDTPKYTTDGFPLITSKNIYSGKLLFDGANLISKKDHRQICERSRVDKGDILFAMIGSIGNPVVVETDREFSIKNVALFKYYSAADSEPHFLLKYLQLVAEEMKAKAAGGVQSFVSLGFLRNYIFPLPPLIEQRRIVAIVDELMTLVDALETQLTAARTTATSLLTAAVAELTAN